MMSMSGSAHSASMRSYVRPPYRSRKATRALACRSAAATISVWGCSSTPGKNSVLATPRPATPRRSLASGSGLRILPQPRLHVVADTKRLVVLAAPLDHDHRCVLSRLADRAQRILAARHPIDIFVEHLVEEDDPFVAR